jgi:hypothetical protein
MVYILIACLTPDKNPESYVVTRAPQSPPKWIQRKNSTSTFFDDLISEANTTVKEDTRYLDSIFDSVVRKQGVTHPPEILVTFIGRRFQSLIEWKIRLRELEKIISNEGEIKEWTNRYGALHAYHRGKLV